MSGGQAIEIPGADEFMPLVQVHGPDDVRIGPVPVPQAGPRDVVVRVAACGICGSDLGYIAKGGLTGPSDRPLPLGHELAGTIAAVGSEVAGLRPGMRVVVNPDSNLIGGGGPGAFAPYLLVHNARRDLDVLPIPDHLPFHLAALAEPLSVALHGVNRAEVNPHSKVVVLGAGPIGLGVVIGLRARGVRDIVSVDLSEQRLELARRLGAAATVNPKRQDLREVLIERHGSSEIFGWPMVNSDVYIDATGAGSVLQQVVQMSRTGARLVVVALHRQPVPVDMVQVMAKELVITGAIAYPTEFPEAVGLLTAGAADFEAKISHRFDFSEFSHALSVARDTERAVKVVVEFAD